MSSIFGKFNKRGEEGISADLGLMLEALNYWNADAANVWTSGQTGLGHLMLYNTARSLKEKQPLHEPLYQLSITADARIDNRKEIYSLLQVETADGELLTDSALILRLYKKYGENCVNYLVGDFAFAIWDEREQVLFCARDHMGVKPFFYYNDASVFAFASEKKGLLCLPGIDKTIDQPFFYNQVLAPVIQAADTTLYKHIRRLAPAHTLTFHAAGNKVALKKYWTLDAETEIIFTRKEEYYEGLLHYFEEAVKCRLSSHYPLGAELSGGLDSSAIAGAANHFLRAEGRKIITLSNAFLEEDLLHASEWQNERKYVDAVNEFNGIEDYILVTKNIWENVADEIDFALDMNDGLEMWSPTWLMPLKKAAMQKNIRTLLSGFPGDEMVSYRGQFSFLDHLDKGQYLKYFSANSERKFVKLKPFMGPDMEFFFHKLKNRMALNDGEERDIARFFGINGKARSSKGDVVWKDADYRERFKSYRHFQKYRLLKTQIALRMEAETRFGQYFKTEPRYPMADIRLVQFYLSIPNHIKYEGSLSRTAYRTAVHKYLPEMVFLRDDKLGNIMPFKSSPQAQRNAQFFLLTTLNKFENKSLYNNAIKTDPVVHRYTKQTFLELIRWFEKKF